MVASKYGHLEGDWTLDVTKESYGVSLWKHIQRGWGRISQYVKWGWIMAVDYNFGLILGVGILS